MNSLTQLKNNLFNKSKNDEENIVRQICVVMREFNMTYEEIKKLPLPTFNIMSMVLEKEQKEMKKNKRGMLKHKKNAR
jgi:hypothetical protein